MNDIIIQQIVTLSKYGHDALDICHPSAKYQMILETWHHKCASQKKQNHTLSAVAMTTVLTLVVC